MAKYKYILDLIDNLKDGVLQRTNFTQLSYSHNKTDSSFNKIIYFKKYINCGKQKIGVSMNVCIYIMIGNYDKY